MVSNGGGTDPTWDDDGKRIFFLNGERMMAVDLNIGQGGLRPSNPYELFEVAISLRSDIWTYDKIPGKDAFVVIMNSEEMREPWPGDLVYIRNWRAGWEEK